MEIKKMLLELVRRLFVLVILIIILSGLWAFVGCMIDANQELGKVAVLALAVWSAKQVG